MRGSFDDRVSSGRGVWGAGWARGIAPGANYRAAPGQNRGYTCSSCGFPMRARGRGDIWRTAGDAHLEFHLSLNRLGIYVLQGRSRRRGTPLPALRRRHVAPRARSPSTTGGSAAEVTLLNSQPGARNRPPRGSPRGLPLAHQTSAPIRRTRPRRLCYRGVRRDARAGSAAQDGGTTWLTSLSLTV
jgi:hypothetical protein